MTSSIDNLLTDFEQTLSSNKDTTNITNASNATNDLSSIKKTNSNDDNEDNLYRAQQMYQFNLELIYLKIHHELNELNLHSSSLSSSSICQTLLKLSSLINLSHSSNFHQLTNTIILQYNKFYNDSLTLLIKRCIAKVVVAGYPTVGASSDNDDSNNDDNDDGKPKWFDKVSSLLSNASTDNDILQLNELHDNHPIRYTSEAVGTPSDRNHICDILLTPLFIKINIVLESLEKS